MALSLYNQKRNFKKTSEPAGKKLAAQKSAALIFVVQQHAASHLHFDFRLEMEGVLKSWAVPKGPSLNPDDKRLAMMVEDHPYDYKDFEGTIPEGNYGAGNVIVWDNGTYHAIETTDAVESEKILLKGLRKGHISFILKGKKLKGEFALVQMKGRGENAWLLIKKNDEYASDEDILKKDKSVISKKKLDANKKKISIRGRSASKAIKKKMLHETPEKIKRKRELVRPMLAETDDAPFDDKDWVFEIKYDGYRALADLDGDGNVEFYSRNLLSFNEAYHPVVEELKKIDHDALLDGEVVVEDEKGRSHFQLLQNYRTSGQGPLKYYVFDLLRLDGKDTTHLTLLERKELLKLFLKKKKFKNIYYSEHIENKGKEFFEAAVKNKLEGIMAKHTQGIYQVNTRSREWLKIKISAQQEAVIGGITEPRGGRKLFGSLLLGVYENKKLRYIGHCGTGFNESVLKELYKKFEPYFTSSSPFDTVVKTNTKAQWIKPKFVCEIKFTEWTKDGSMRHPVFLGLRKDKNPTEVKREMAVEEVKKKTGKKPVKTSAKENTEENQENNYELKTGNVTLKLTNQDKIYFPGEKITKGDVVNYYREISKIILPYLVDRPQSMNRFPNGISGLSFYQKDVDKTKIPGWIKTEKIFSESNNKYINYIVCNDEATLIYLANLGCIEINPWNAKIDRPENPDWMVIDLDPEKISFKEVVKAAKEVRHVLEEMDIECYCKTSGATGLHVFVPLEGRYDYDIVKTFAQLVAKTVNERLPETTSILRIPSKRQGKVYLDFLQNRRGQTLAAPYSVRPKPGATVSMPLTWDEVNASLDPSRFTIRNTLDRLKKKGDLWKPVIGKGVDLKKALGKIK
jgi:bifunctional non-homologous end joining protein LigD